MRAITFPLISTHDIDVNAHHLLTLWAPCLMCAPQLIGPKWRPISQAPAWLQQLVSSASPALDIFICGTAPLLLCICDFLIPFVSSECHSFTHSLNTHTHIHTRTLPALKTKPIYHRPEEGLRFVCFGGSGSISCSPNERGYSVPASPQRLEGARSPVPRPTWGGNYLSGVPQRGAPSVGLSNSPTLDFHLGAPSPASIVRGRPLRLDVT